MPFHDYFRTIRSIIFSLQVCDSPGNAYDEEAWKRVVQYGRRIKTLYMNAVDLSTESRALTEYVREIVSKRPPPVSSLLPNLQDLEINKGYRNEDEERKMQMKK